MGFFRSLFSSNNTKQTRHLNHPRDLIQGDIIRFKYLAQEDISGQNFEIAQVNSYRYGNEICPELVIKDSLNSLYYLMVEEEDGEEYLALSKKINKAEITDLVSPEDIEEIKRKGIGSKISVNHCPEHLSQWLANHYVEVDDNIVGEYITGDMRNLGVESYQKGDAFSSHLLEDKSGDFALELELYDSGYIELSATVYLDINDIEEMWPVDPAKH